MGEVKALNFLKREKAKTQTVKRAETGGLCHSGLDGSHDAVKAGRDVDRGGIGERHSSH